MADTTLGLALGSAAALCLGVGDFVARGVTHAVGWKRTLLWLQVASLAPLVVVALVVTGPVQLSVGLSLRIGVLGAINFVGAVGLYRSFATGTLSLVAPVASTFAVVTVGLTALFGLAPGARVLVGLTGTVAGLGVATFPGGGRDRTAAGVGWALLSSLGFGTVFYLLDGAAAELGPVWPIAGMRMVAIVLTWITLRTWKEESAGVVPWRAVGLVALLDSAGLVAYTAGTLHANVAVVAVIASCFAVVTIVLAQVRLRETLTRWQWVGVGMVVVGVAWTTWFSRAAAP